MRFDDTDHEVIFTINLFHFKISIGNSTFFLLKHMQLSASTSPLYTGVIVDENKPAELRLTISANKKGIKKEKTVLLKGEEISLEKLSVLCAKKFQLKPKEYRLKDGTILNSLESVPNDSTVFIK